MTQQISRHRAAMRRHRRTSNMLTAAATGLGLLAIMFAMRGSLAPFGLVIIVSVFIGEAAGRAHRDYRLARSRALQAERGRASNTSCCATWAASSRTVHGPYCHHDTEHRAA